MHRHIIALAALISSSHPAAAQAPSDTYRPQFHFTPAQGFISDPNGLFHYQGKYHLFHQHSPHSIKAGTPQHWGHAVSTDLVHWERRGNPEPFRPYDGGYIWSGSVVIDTNNVSHLKSPTSPHPPILAYYTWAPYEVPKDFDRRADQRLAYSTDGGDTWQQYSKNPLIKSISQAQGSLDRDPCVIWHEKAQTWVMLLFQHNAKFLVFHSTNLLDWGTPVGTITPPSAECPDIFELPVADDPHNTRWVLMGARGDYVVGDFDGTAFKTETGPHFTDYNGLLKRFYATQTWKTAPDKQRIVQIACLRDRDELYMDQQTRNQQTFPCALTLRATPAGHRLYREPVKEITTLYEGAPRETIRPQLGARESLPLGPAELAEITLTFTPAKGSITELNLRGSRIVYYETTQTLIADEVAAPLTSEKGIITLRVLLDRSSLEIYGNGGIASISKHIRPALESRDLHLKSLGGGAKNILIKIQPLKPIW